MTNTPSNHDLGKRIEQLIGEHIAASRKAAQDALERAFAATTASPSSSAKLPKRVRAVSSPHRRLPEEVAALGERFYEAVCAKPGERMIVLVADVGASARELRGPVTLLKRAGRVRSVGARDLTRYFPMANKPAASA